MIREIDDVEIKPKGKAKKKGTKENMNDSGMGESFNVIIEFFKYHFHNIELYLLIIFVIKNSNFFSKESTSSIEEDQNKVGILNESKDSHDESLIEAGNITV